jgi:hypothetical protein
MQYDGNSMMDSLRNLSEKALKQKTLSLPQYRLLMRHFEKALRAYTYLWAEECVCMTTLLFSAFYQLSVFHSFFCV